MQVSQPSFPTLTTNSLTVHSIASTNLVIPGSRDAEVASLALASGVYVTLYLPIRSADRECQRPPTPVRALDDGTFWHRLVNKLHRV